VKSVCRILSLALVLLAGGPVMAASQEIAGIWRGTLQIDPKTAMTIEFAFASKPDGQYSAVLNSPTSGAIKNVAAKAVSLQDDTVKVDVPALSGTFSGTVKAGSIEGKWAQPGGSFPLVLSPYQPPQMSKADIDTIVGTWSGPLRQSVPITFVLRLKLDERGELTGALSVPEQGSNEYPLAEAQFGSGKLTFKLPIVQGQFTASFANGALEGVWTQAGSPSRVPVTLKKGAVTATAPVLKISGEAFLLLSGQWTGTLKVKNPQGQEISVPLAMLLMTDVRVQIIGFIDSPAQGAKNLPITEASLEGGKFVARIGGIGAEFHGDLSGNTLKGEWIQGPQRLPLTFTRQPAPGGSRGTDPTR
jgi:hypothetical protein